jgi:hypothetical protein
MGWRWDWTRLIWPPSQSGKPVGTNRRAAA